ncbi:hypothetical protein BH11PSE11_BH11PSE11_24260 [soil metagenome]
MNTQNYESANRQDTPHVRVYLVEDSPEIRDLIVDEVNAIPGVAITGYADTELEALKDLSEQSFDVIIFDLQLRQGNSLSLLRSLGSRGCQRDALKFVFTSHVSRTYHRLCEQLGVRRVFDKSSEFVQLCGAMRAVASKGPTH